MIKNILLIDDDTISNFVTEHIIENYNKNIKVRIAENGYTGKKILTDETDYCCQIIFLDINMPIMNGFEFLDWYENEYKNETKARIVLVSSSSRKEDMEKAFSYKSVVNYIEKPIKEDILKKLEFIISQQNSSD